MRSKEREELTRAVDVMKSADTMMRFDPLDCVSTFRRALIRAVELLAAQVPVDTNTSSDATPERPPTTFDEGLVERLAEVHRKALNEHTGSLDGARRAGASAILSELAAMPVEMPTVDEVFQAWFAVGNINAERDGLKGGAGVVEMLRTRLAPILAAKDARIAELQAMRTEDAQAVAVAADKVDELRKRIAELEKRLAEQTAPVDATGKMPGQVYFETRRRAWIAEGHAHKEWRELTEREQRIEEASNQAVIRAFGQNTADALRKVRKTIDVQCHEFVVSTSAEELTTIVKESVLKAFDDELAKLEGATKTTVSRTNEPVVFQMCANCDKPQGMHYDPGAKIGTCCSFKPKRADSTSE